MITQIETSQAKVLIIVSLYRIIFDHQWYILIFHLTLVRKKSEKDAYLRRYRHFVKKRV